MRSIPCCVPVLFFVLILSGIGISIHSPSAIAEPTVISTISVGNYPGCTAVNPSTNRVYVSHYFSDSVSVIDGDTNIVISSISVGNTPDAIAVNPSTNRIYTANSAEDSVSVIDGDTNTVISTISVTVGYNSAPYEIGVNTSTNRIYVAHLLGDAVSVIDGDTNTVISTISMSQPSGVGVNSSTNRIYVISEDSNVIRVIDGATDTVISSISLTNQGVGVNPSTNRIYAAGGSNVYVIDGDTNTVTSTISVGFRSFDVGVNPSTNRIYVANTNGNTVSVIDGTTNKVISTISVGNQPDHMGVNSLTNRIYVPNRSDDTVSVIEDSPSSAIVTTGSATDVTSNFATLNGTVNANGESTTAWFDYGTISSAYTGSSTTQSVSGSSDTSVSIGISGLSTSTTYYYRIAAQNSAGTSYGSEASFTTSTPSDTTAPTGSLSINSGASYTNLTTVTLNLSATDDTGVTGYYVSDSYSTPSASASGWTSVTSTTSYSGTVSYSLTSGEGGKTIYAWYKDAAGNVSSAANATITLDTTVPTATISSPTSNSTYTATSSTISMGGSASDSVSGISTVSWSNDRGGNGTATGTASWTVSTISLSTGDNVITVTAKDGAGNSGTDTLQVTYGTGSTVSAPTVSTGSASSVTTSSATLSGTVNANSGTTTAWFQYGSTSGSYGNTSSVQTVTGSSNTTVSIDISGLSLGTKYYYRIAAQNSTGTSYGSESSFTTTSAAIPTPTPSTADTTAPTVTITSPTSSSTYTTTSSAITLSGTASDNSGSVSSVTWSNSKGESGTASGTTSWTISGISLSSGDNVITVTATDGSGNSGTDKITVTYNATTTQPPTVMTGSATNVTATSATVTGTVNANGLSTTAWFEYGTVEGTYGNKTTTQTVTGSDDTTVSSAITGLSADTTYYYRIAAQNNSGTSYGEEMSFQYSSKGSAPTVATEAATDATSTSATLNGKCNPNGLSTTAWFEYGTLSGTYEYKTSTQSISGSSYTDVSAAITGLTAGTTYYYRIVAKNSVGTSYGTEMEFYKSPGTDTTPTPAATPTSSCTDDYEPNDDFQNAYGPMESGKSYEGKLCSSEDKDYFKFELENPNTIQLTLNVPSGNDYDLYLYDSSGTEVSNSHTTEQDEPPDKMTEQTETITHNAISTGIYFIQVFGYGGAYDEDLPYTLAGTWTASLVPTPTSVASPVPNPTGTPAATGVIIGSVTDAVTSETVRGATVSTDDGEYSATTNQAGRFTLLNIPTGSYTLTASAVGYESASQSVTVTAGAPTQTNFNLNSLLSPSPTPVSFNLCEVYGFVTDEDDHDLSEVNVTIKGTKDSRSALTDEDGYFEFTGLKAGKYTVTYENKGYRKQSEDITLIEGESRDLGVIVMELNIAGIIYGTVTDAENDPIGSAKVKLKSKGSNAKVKEKYTTSEDGTYEFADLEEGTYIIQAKKKGYKKAKERIKLSDGEDKEVGLVLEEK